MRDTGGKCLVWFVLVTFAFGCQADLVDSVGGPLSLPTEELGRQSGDDEQTEVGSEESQPEHLEDSSPSLLKSLLGLVIRLVTSLGGTLEIRDSRLVIPPLALIVPRVISFSIVVSTPVGLIDPLPRLYYFTPHELQFNVPSKLYVSFTDAGLGNRDPGLYLCYWDSVGSWVAQPTVVDTTNERFMVTLHHFSRYAFGR